MRPDHTCVLADAARCRYQEAAEKDTRSKEAAAAARQAAMQADLAAARAAQAANRVAAAATQVRLLPQSVMHQSSFGQFACLCQHVADCLQL